jgi:hypothetical protein
VIFGPRLVGLVLVGKKTETRRLVQTVPRGATKTVGPRGRRRVVDVVTLPDGVTVPCRYEVGKSYAVQRGRGRPADGRILVTAVERQRLGDLDFDAARAEGFRTTADFWAYWKALHPAPALSTAALTALQLLADVAPHAIPIPRTPAVRSLEHRGLVTLTDAGHELTAAGADAVALPPPGPDLDASVWVIRFKVDQTDRPQLLRTIGNSPTYPRGPGHYPEYVHPDPPMDPDAEHGYTTRPVDALDGEPEVLEPLDPNWKRVSEARHAATRASRLAELGQIEDIGDRLRALKAAAHEQGVNVRDDLRVIERRLADIEKKLNPQNRRAA